MNPNTFTTPISLDEGNKSSGKGSVSPKKLKKPKIISGYTRLSGRTIESDSFSEDIYEGTQESIPSFQELIEQAVIDRTALSTENTPEITLKTKYTKHDTKQIKASVITKTRNLTTPYNYEQEVKISLSVEGEKQKREEERKQREIEAKQKEEQKKKQERLKDEREAEETRKREEQRKKEAEEKKRKQAEKKLTEDKAEADKKKQPIAKKGSSKLAAITKVAALTVLIGTGISVPMYLKSKKLSSQEMIALLERPEFADIRGILSDHRVIDALIKNDVDFLSKEKGIPRDIVLDIVNEIVRLRIKQQKNYSKYLEPFLKKYPNESGTFHDDLVSKELEKETRNHTLSLLREKLVIYLIEARGINPKKLLSSNQSPASVVSNPETPVKPTNSRHTALESDPSVQYLKKLEEKYKDNPAELAKVMAIKVHPEYIEMGGVKLKRRNETASDNPKEEIYNYKGTTYFMWNAAMRTYGYLIPSEKQWAAVISATPGSSDSSEGKNFIKILGLSYAGIVIPMYSYSKEEMYKEVGRSILLHTSSTYYCSGCNGGEDVNYYVEVNGPGSVSIGGISVGGYGAFPVRLLYTGPTNGGTSKTERTNNLRDNMGSSVVHATQLYRHTAPESDPIVQFLKTLEIRYKNDPIELKKVMMIKVHPNTIEIAGFKLKKHNEILLGNENEGIRNQDGDTHFKFDIAMRLYGKKIPSKDQWSRILDAIPGNSNAQHGFNFVKILSISHVRGIYSGGNSRGSGLIWSSTKKDAESAWGVLISDQRIKAMQDSESCDYYNFVRLFAD